MSREMMLIALHEILCATAFYGVFCRLVRVNSQTKVEIRLGFFILGFAVCCGVVEPLSGWIPSIFSLSLLTAVVVIQVSTAPRWVKGVPEKFKKQPEGMV